MESGGRVPYEIKTGWLGRGMKIAGLTGNGLALALPMPLLIRGVPQNDNFYPVKGIMPSKDILELVANIDWFCKYSSFPLKSVTNPPASFIKIMPAAMSQ